MLLPMIYKGTETQYQKKGRRRGNGGEGGEKGEKRRGEGGGAGGYFVLWLIKYYQLSTQLSIALLQLYISCSPLQTFKT